MATDSNKNLTVFELIKQEMFRNEVYCGPYKSDIAYFPFVRDLSNKDLEGVKHIIPQEGFHPKVAIAIDFTHTFVQTLESVPRKKLIDPERLTQETERIANFVKFYFENIYAFGSDKKVGNTPVTKLDETPFTRELDKNSKDSQTQNRFLNEIINYLITDINVQRGRSEIGSATVTFKDNKNLVSGSSVAQRALTNPLISVLEQLFVPMLPIRIWSRGRLYSDYYFPIFDGYISSISFNDSQGFAEIQLQAKDVLELARFSYEMTNPSLIQQAEKKKVNAINLLAKPFYGHNHVKIIKTLLAGGNLEFDGANTHTFSLNADGSAVEDDNVAKAEADAKAKKKSGAQAKAVAETGGDSINLLALDKFEVVMAPDTDLIRTAMHSRAIHKDNFNIHKLVDQVSHSVNRRKLIIWGEDITPYRVWNIQSVSTFESTFSSRLDILREVATNVYYELYVDGAGNVHYHPQRFANKFLKNYLVDSSNIKNNSAEHEWSWPGINVVGPEETTSVAPTLNFESLVTFLKITGQDPVNAIEAELGGIVGSAVNKKYISRFGYRRDIVNNPMFNINVAFQKSSSKDKKSVNTFGNIAAASLLVYQNADLYTKQLSMIHRPELMDLGFPVYFTEDDTVFYVNSMNHTINIGGDATTSMNCSFGRKYKEPAADLQSFIIMTEKVYKTNGNVSTEDLLTNLPIRDWSNYLDTEDVKILDQALKDARLAARMDNL